MDDLVSALSAAGQAVLAFEDGVCVFASEEFTALSGLTANRVTSIASLFVHAPDDALGGGRFEAELIQADGTVVPVDVAVSAALRGDSVRHIVFIRDAMDMARLATALSWSRDELDERMHAGPFAIVEFDPSGKIVRVEGTGLPLLGLPAGFLRGIDVIEYARAAAPHLVSVLKRALSGEVFSGEIDALGRVLAVRFGPVRDERGAITAVAGLAVDLTKHAGNGIIPRTIAVARPLVRSIIEDIRKLGQLDVGSMGVVGRRLAADSGASTLEEYLDEFKEGGLGELTCVEAAPNRWRFQGSNMFEVERGSRKPTCHMALGYLCGTMSRLHGDVAAIGTELFCESRGDRVCEFRVALRRS